MASNTNEFVLTDDHIEEEIMLCFLMYANFFDGLHDDELIELRDSHVIALLSNHADPHEVTENNLKLCKSITGDSLAYIADHFPLLEYLYASHDCSISSVLPDNFGDNLKHLKELTFHNNNITTVPASIGELKDLECLAGLSNNNITKLPTSIEKLRNLRELGLDGNKITTLPCPVSIANLVRPHPGGLNFEIIENLLSKPLEEWNQPVVGMNLQGIEQYFKTQK